MTEREKTLGILTIATNKYLYYWFDLVRSYIATNSESSICLTWHVFTDRSSEAIAFTRQFHQIEFKIHEIESMTFPLATLLRYELYFSARDEIKHDLLMHLDADMLVMNLEFSKKLLNTKIQDGMITLVKHPGYWRPHGFELMRLYCQRPLLMVKDIRFLATMGGRGAWESNAKSSAFVERSKRRNYFCGGIWWGPYEPIIAMCEQLATRTSADFAKGIEAIWHDESHLNWYASGKKNHSVDPSFCFDPSYENLKSLPEIVRAVDKHANPQ